MILRLYNHNIINIFYLSTNFLKYVIIVIIINNMIKKISQLDKNTKKKIPTKSINKKICYLVKKYKKKSNNF